MRATCTEVCRRQTEAVDGCECLLGSIHRVSYIRTYVFLFLSSLTLTPIPPLLLSLPLSLSLPLPLQLAEDEEEERQRRMAEDSPYHAERQKLFDSILVVQEDMLKQMRCKKVSRAFIYWEDGPAPPPPCNIPSVTLLYVCTYLSEWPCHSVRICTYIMCIYVMCSNDWLCAAAGCNGGET